VGAIEHPPIFTVPGVPDHVLYMWVAMAILIVVSFAATRRLELVPHGLQNFMEVVLEQFLALLDDVIGHGGRRYFPLIATLGLFILVSNLLGLIPGLIAPTGNLNTTAACALIVFVTYHVIGARKVGVLAYLRHFAGPLLDAELFPNKVVDVAFKLILVPLFFVIEIFSHLARPLSLALRLFGNMAGDVPPDSGDDRLDLLRLPGRGRARRSRLGPPHRLHELVPVPPQAPGRVPAGVHFLHAIHALHRRCRPGNRTPLTRQDLPRRRPSCDVH
jgi:F-type H+-transporting ATPase subunit a